MKFAKIYHDFIIQSILSITLFLFCIILLLNHMKIHLLINIRKYLMYK